MDSAIKKYVSETKRRMGVEVSVLIGLAMVCLFASAAMLVVAIHKDNVVLAQQALSPLLNLFVGFVLGLLGFRVLKAMEQTGFWQDGFRLVLSKMVRITLVFALVIQPMATILVMMQFDSLIATHELGIISYIGFINWPVLILGLVLHLLVAIQKTGQQLAEDQEYTV